MTKRNVFIMCLLTALASLSLASCAIGENGSGDEQGPSATVIATEGDVTARINPADTFSPPQIGDILAPGDALQTGDASWGTLSLLDDTVIVVAPNSELVVSETAGTADAPIIRLALNVGEVFSIRSGAIGPNGVYEVTTPAGVFAIRGTGMSAMHDAVSGTGEGTCLFGACRVTAGGSSTDLTGNQFIVVDTAQGITGQPAPLTPDQLNRWSDALEKASSAGSGQVADAVCDCQNSADLVCDDGTAIAGFPACAVGILSAPAGLQPSPTPASAAFLNVPAWVGTITTTQRYDEPLITERDDNGVITREETTGGTTMSGTVRYELFSPGRWNGTQGDINWTRDLVYNEQVFDTGGGVVYQFDSTETGAANLTLDPVKSFLIIDIDAGTYDLAFIPAGLNELTVEWWRVGNFTGQNPVEPFVSELAVFTYDPCGTCTMRGYGGGAFGTPLPGDLSVLEGTYEMPDGTIITWRLTPEN